MEIRGVGVFLVITNYSIFFSFSLLSPKLDQTTTARTKKKEEEEEKPAGTQGTDVADSPSARLSASACFYLRMALSIRQKQTGSLLLSPLPTLIPFPSLFLSGMEGYGKRKTK